MRGSLICVALAAVSCAPHEVAVEYAGREYIFSRAERSAIQRIADATASEVRGYLPGLPATLVLRVEPGSDVIPEIGAGATAVPPAWVRWTVDPTRPEGVLAITETHLRAALFHEFHHLVRGVRMNTLMDEVITEGAATAFERDFAGADPLWGQYPDDVSAWVRELRALPLGARRDHWLFRHPDGRRWIGYKAGTYLIDQAMRRSGRNAADLVSVSTGDVLALAGVDREPPPAIPPGSR